MNTPQRTALGILVPFHFLVAGGCVKDTGNTLGETTEAATWAGGDPSPPSGIPSGYGLSGFPQAIPAQASAAPSGIPSGSGFSGLPNGGAGQPSFATSGIPGGYGLSGFPQESAAPPSSANTGKPNAPHDEGSAGHLGSWVPGNAPDGHGPDGHDPDGHGPEGHGFRGHSPDGHGPDGHGPDGLGHGIGWGGAGHEHDGFGCGGFGRGGFGCGLWGGDFGDWLDECALLCSGEFSPDVCPPSCCSGPDASCASCPIGPGCVHQ
jgi:hypothetical protein